MPGTPYILEDTLDQKTTKWDKVLDEFRENNLEQLNKCALIIIDMQRYFTDENGRAFLPAGNVIIPQINRLITYYRNAGKPVIFTRHGHKRGLSAGLMGTWWNGRLIFEDEDEAELDPRLEVATVDKIIKKQTYDAFKNTELQDILSAFQTRMLVICGVMTDLCIETTARQAFLNGIQPVVALDATATKNEDLHLSALKTLAHGFAYVEKTDRIIKLIK